MNPNIRASCREGRIIIWRSTSGGIWRFQSELFERRLHLEFKKKHFSNIVNKIIVERWVVVAVKCTILRFSNTYRLMNGNSPKMTRLVSQFDSFFCSFLRTISVFFSVCPWLRLRQNLVRTYNCLRSRLDLWESTLSDQCVCVASSRWGCGNICFRATWRYVS